VQICLFRACLDAWKSISVSISACAFNISSIWYRISSIEPQSISWRMCILNCLLPYGFSDRHSLVEESPPPRKKIHEELIGKPLISRIFEVSRWCMRSLYCFRGFFVHDLHFTVFACFFVTVFFPHDSQHANQFSEEKKICDTSDINLLTRLSNWTIELEINFAPRLIRVSVQNIPVFVKSYYRMYYLTLRTF